MENEAPKKSSIANSILAKFQLFNKEKEETAKEKQLENKDFSKLFPEQNQRKRKFQDETLHAGISEKDVGITKYISDHCGFTGILKHRFSDFQVHEIDLDGSVVELTSTEVADLPIEANDELINKDALPKDSWDQIEEALKSEDANKTVEIDVSDKSKAERSVIHKTLKNVFGPKIFSNTVTNDEKTVIRVGKATKKERVNWPEHLPQFLHFTVAKKNMDSTHFICLIAKKLRVKPNLFTYAGTKDRRAITTQRLCVKRKEAQELAKQTIWGVKIGNYEYKSKPLRLGDLSGNKFTIALRNITAEDNVVQEAMENLKKSGFINYFGLQRFGSSAVAPTFTIGKAILKKDWKLAVELILKPRADEKAPVWVKSARETWWQTREAGATLRYLSRHQNSIEYRVLKALKTNPSDFHGALLTIPRNTLLLYLHSYQSFIWNNIVSRRIEKFGMVPNVGDLVLDTSEPVDDEILPESPDSPGKVEEEEADAEEPSADEEEVKKKISVRVLTEEDVKTTSIYDVVYPLPGHDVEYPKNEIADWYEEMLKKDDISHDALKSNNKLFSLYGTYRKAFQKALNLSWKFARHDNFDDDLVLSDFDKLENVSLPEQSADGKYKSVILDITLKPSTYATMALREAMKADTSVSFHASLTKNIQEKGEKKLRLSPEKSNVSEERNGNLIST